IIENTFKTAHNVIVPNLQQGKTYRFRVDCVNQSGQPVPGGDVTAATRSGACPERIETTTCNTLTMSNPSATAGSDYIGFSWTTNQLASTEVMFSPSPDLSVNYIAAVKKVGDVVTQGWVTREGPRQFETSHGIRLAGLEPSTKYYYNMRSWTFENNSETGNPMDKVGYVGNITTLPGLPPPTIKIRVRSPSEGNISVPDMPVLIKKNTDIDFGISVSSGQSGVSNDVILERGTGYTFEVQGNACYEGGSTQLNVSANAQGALPEVVVNVNKIPPRRGFVVDRQNNVIPGATISGKNSAGASVSVTGAANSSWIIEGLNPGSYTFTVTKDGYKTTTANATVSPCGRFVALPITMVPRDYTLNITIKNQTNKPVKNAAVLIKEGNATIATLTTDTQGKATKAGTFNDDNEHIFTVTVTPVVTATENILPTQDFISITSDSTRNMTITCPADKKAPAASQIKISQVGQYALQVSFKLDDENGKSCVERQSPQGQISTTPWKAGIYSPGSGVSDHTVLVQSSSMKSGTYKIKIKTKDKWNNTGESEVSDFLLFGESLWDFKAAQTGSNVTFTWGKYPYRENFAKYTIKIGTGAPIEIADINTTTYTLTNYSSATVRQANLTALSTDNSNLARPAMVSLQAVATSQQTQQSQSNTNQTGQDAAEKTLLKFISKPSKAYVNIEMSLKMRVQTVRALKLAADCNLAWGDGKKEKSDTEITLKHTYLQPGNYTISAAASLKESGTYPEPSPVSTNITVSVKPPNVSLSKSKVANTSREYKFTIKAEDGSYPVGNWTLSFGDGTSESGKGTVSKIINHVYQADGSYKAEFSVTDTIGTAVKKTSNITIVPKN
ncbi:MAG: carboxypeptidase regulatory-like domain-containing protein, partial [Sedimentisphaerales bacterium]|nr:carboxypeptidase regulatory-like domain-containing protein [Sedimentisphaerales bacterium]